MTLVGFSFTKIHAEKRAASDQNVKIENNIGITNVVLANVIDPKRSIVKFEFAFNCKYEPGLGIIELHGELMEMFEKELAVKITENWEKDKKLHPDIMSKVLNVVMSRANIEAIIISRELQLPPPVQLPKIEVKSKGPEKAQSETIMVTAEKKEVKKEEKKETVKEDKPKKK